ncbi:MAG TPA: hypothetical protein VIK30_06340, partial [Polyangia bacterium]
MKQAQSIEITYLINGEVISVRRLSQRGEWRSGASTFGLCAAMSTAAALVVALALLVAHRVVYGPAYVALWLVIGLGVASLAAV